MNNAILCAMLLLAIARPVAATEFVCPLGDPVSANLGDGVTMRTCMWQKEANLTIRVGPFELVKNGILILKSQTNTQGQLHGRFTSWNDAGEIIENGNYVRGQKHGEWLETDTNGISATHYYDAGNRVEP